ncbi:fumarylacetoacetate hydrolase family protein [Nocardia sp. KC 131]|uniref:fumarylacetoacetate hydrolase family protein n=1 Tax=Nocardia arseniciresistens TaxID=3392119 RepID=UPI00398E6FFC
MHLATFPTTTGASTVVCVEADRRQPLDAPDVAAYLRMRAAGKSPSPTTAVLDETAGPLAVVTTPTKVICCGHNYRAHITEMGRGVPVHPTLFTKFADTLTGARSEIAIPGNTADAIDWEAELAVVVGADLYQADAATARAAIAGYCVANDVSVRSWQHHTPQWLPGKAFDATTPIGPVLVTADEIDPADGLRITCRVDGVIRQRSTTDDLLFDAPTLLSYISMFTTLRPGDVVLTGTPGGVGAAATPPEYLHDGSIVETEIEGIGLLRNTITISARTCSTSGVTPFERELR